MRQSLKILLLLVGAVVGLFRKVMSDSLPAEPKDDPQEHSKLTFWQAAKVLLIAAVVAGFIGVVVLISGVMPIKASSGHWRVTRWFLDFAMQRSVATHSVTIEAPLLSDPMLVQKGAGAY